MSTEPNTVAEYLEKALTNADAFSFVSAYFTVHGYALLAEQLERVGNTRFLFGDPTSVEDLEVWPESHWPGFALRQADVLQSYTA